jgi:YbbR domain-containing protein
MNENRSAWEVKAMAVLLAILLWLAVRLTQFRSDPAPVKQSYGEHHG